jgi:hypothetical protein
MVLNPLAGLHVRSGWAPVAQPGSLTAEDLEDDDVQLFLIRAPAHVRA